MNTETILGLDYKALQQACKTHNLKAVGKKEVLVERLLSMFKPKTDDLAEAFGTMAVGNYKFKRLNPEDVYFEHNESVALHMTGKLLFDFRNCSNIDQELDGICTSVSNATGISKGKCYTFACGIWSMFLDEIKTNPDKSPEQIFAEFVQHSDEMLPTFQN